MFPTGCPRCRCRADVAAAARLPVEYLLTDAFCAAAAHCAQAESAHGAEALRALRTKLDGAGDAGAGDSGLAAILNQTSEVIGSWKAAWDGPGSAREGVGDLFEDGHSGRPRRRDIRGQGRVGRGPGGGVQSRLPTLPLPGEELGACINVSGFAKGVAPLHPCRTGPNGSAITGIERQIATCQPLPSSAGPSAYTSSVPIPTTATSRTDPTRHDLFFPWQDLKGRMRALDNLYAGAVANASACVPLGRGRGVWAVYVLMICG